MLTSLSVLVPAYNEEYLLYESLRRLNVLSESPFLARVEIIVVDDSSTDETACVIEKFRAKETGQTDSIIQWIFLRHDINRGKGKAVRTALQYATCEISVIHDADLEYHPKDLLRIVEVFVEEHADAVYGSRFTGERRRVLFYRHQLGNKCLTFLSNVVTNLNLSDMETCYKAIRTSLFKSIPITSNDFRIEPELTIKLAKRGARIFEIPISYSGRTYDEGKKINWKDGVLALIAIAKFTLSNRINVSEENGAANLARLSGAPKFHEWMADTIRPFCGRRVLELGSGVGNVTRKLIPRSEYVASDTNPLYVEILQTLTPDRPYMTAVFCDLTDRTSFPKSTRGFDTVICLNVIEHLVDEYTALLNINSVMDDGGKAIILVPQGQWNFGSLDKAVGHKRRYDRDRLRKMGEQHGFRVIEIMEFNRIGTVAWFLNGRLLRRRRFGRCQIWALNLLSPVFRLIDSRLPLPGLSLIAVLEKQRQVTSPEGTRRSSAVVGIEDPVTSTPSIAKPTPS